MKFDISIFIPCYNEEKNIINSIKTAISVINKVNLTYELIIVDDGSIDNSVHLINDFIKNNPNLNIKSILNNKNHGLGYSFAEAAFIAEGTYFRQVNGDNDETPETLEKILLKIGQADIIMCYHERILNKKFFRKVLSSLFTKIVNLITGNNLKYYNGLPIFKTKDVQRWHSRTPGFGYQAELITKLLFLKKTYIEVPVMAMERPFGESKAISMKNFFYVGITLLRLLVDRILAPQHNATK
ncbi:MAG: glycosyltransferase family 2 protein [Gammaproteobacteria bacterium]